MGLYMSVDPYKMKEYLLSLRGYNLYAWIDRVYSKNNVYLHFCKNIQSYSVLHRMKFTSNKLA